MSVLIFAAGMLSAGCENNSVAPDFPLETPDPIDSTDYEIYSLILNETFSSEKIVIAQKSIDHIRVTFDDDYIDHFTENFPDFDTTLVENLCEVNDTTYLFADKFHSDDNQLIVVSPDELAHIFDSRDVNNNWQEFYQKYKNAVGYIRFSRIGYNDDKDQAILDTGYYFGSLGAEGNIIYLVKEKGQWVIKDRMMTWIS